MTDMQKALIIVGAFDEILIDVERIESVEAVAKLDAAGRPMLPGRRSDYSEPTFDGSAIRTYSGHEYLVPQSVETIHSKMQRVIEAARREQDR